MRYTFIALAGGFLWFCIFGYADDHAPTVAQCQADQRLWWNQLDNDKEAISKLTVRQLNERSGEMNQCGIVDKQHVESYSRTAAMFHLEIENRLRRFLERHGLMKQFVDEDRAGKR